MNFEIIEETGRIDKVISQLTDASRSKIQKSIKDHKVQVNGKVVSSSYQVQPGDRITILEEEKDDNVLEAKDIPLDVVFEDDNLLIINKPSGLVVHPAPGHTNDTLVNALLYRYPSLKTNSNRPGIVHRLDKDTSGLMIVAKNDKAHELLGDMMKRKEIKRHYLALVEGVIPHETGTIDAPIGRDKDNRLKMKVTSENSKQAVTHFKVLKRFAHHTLIECMLETGRTHQIRVHMDYIGYPIVNDPVYGHHKHTTPFGQMLHSKSIAFIEPLTQESLFFEVDPPQEFMDILASCEKC